ncbi:hypothetical protein NXY56_006555 [Leishmania guyanensis]
MAGTGLPPLDLCEGPVLDREQAFAQGQRSVDPACLRHLVDTIGASNNDVDTLPAAVRQCRVLLATHTSQELLNAMLQPPAASFRAATFPTATGGTLSETQRRCVFRRWWILCCGMP